MRKRLYYPCKEDYYYCEPTSIEYIGYARNDIISAIQQTAALPESEKIKLRLANTLLKEVQEYLYNDPLVS